MTQFTQLFQNIIANAIKFRKKNVLPIVEICATTKRDFVEFSIQDNGIGIEKEELKEVFQLFARVHSKEEYEGSGIGLALCKRIVEQHKGEIEMTSEVGKGTCIKFSLPISH